MNTVGTKVKLTNPAKGEESARFVITENNGDRLMIRLICKLPIAPVETVRPADVLAA